MLTLRNALTVALITAVAAAPAYAGVPVTPLGVPTQLPFGEGGLIGLVAATVIAGAFIARRKR